LQRFCSSRDSWCRRDPQARGPRGGRRPEQPRQPGQSRRRRRPVPGHEQQDLSYRYLQPQQQALRRQLEPGEHDERLKLLLRHDVDRRRGRGDTTAPTVVGSAPMPQKTGVSRKANVTASFSEATDVGKLNNSSVAPYKNNTSTPISRQGHARRQRVGRHAEPVRRHVEAAGGEHVMLGRALDRLDRGQGHGRQPARRERRVPGKLGGGYVYWWFKTKR
jgi:hypothetical protein